MNRRFTTSSSIEQAPPSINKMTYEEALLYCTFLDYRGQNDWRLPTEDEVDGNRWFVWNLDDKSNHNTIWSVVPVRAI